MTTTTERSQLLNMPTAAKRLGCSPSYVYRLVASGELSSVNIALPHNKRPKTRVYEHEIEAFIQSRTSGP